MTAEDFKDSFKYYTITYMHQGYKHSFLEKRQAISQRVYKFNFTIIDDDFNQLAVNSLAQDESDTSEVQDDSNIQVRGNKDNSDMAHQKILLQLQAHLDES